MATTVTTNRSRNLRGLAAAERGDVGQVLAQSGPGCEFVFVRRTARGARLSGPADLRRWFERFRRLLPDPSFDVQRLVIGARCGTSASPRMSSSAAASPANRMRTNSPSF